MSLSQSFGKIRLKGSRRLMRAVYIKAGGWELGGKIAKYIEK